MPEVRRIHGYRFFFFSREGIEPRHIHVERAEHYAKFWLERIRLAKSRGLSAAELREIHSLIAERHAEFIVAWNEHFSQ